MYLYYPKLYKNEQAQLLEMCTNVIIPDGIGCNGLKPILKLNIESVGR